MYITLFYEPTCLHILGLKKKVINVTEHKKVLTLNFNRYSSKAEMETVLKLPALKIFFSKKNKKTFDSSQ